MKIKRRVQEGAIAYHANDLRILARLSAIIEAIVLELTDSHNNVIKVLEVTHTGVPFERRECFDPATFETKNELCAQFYFVLTNIKTGEIKREVSWYSIEK